ncbi:uncharacterized membrane protein HdeD (DUF308 family) [Pseudarthrobacter oxydans]|uniref:Uncharacterized membrane protein HdeD (DUF308 family) n=1 Tax=Pseudarthrobacter oxydans TaxID=1671 RepID=A0AAW8NBD2_PSEOX|nr:hypothetical protein [Pseudarthrobacter oxydans]MDV2980424.1 hypothetical protein [Actinomycetes bacterium ARC8]MDR6793592.1 uncharacterized membrane protein HdeD (DUF308 family) [Pseudarthrobacter oxydans]MDR7164592.1 uncharacterized membrane protein HdeD (DUF308 family) [Pseudarthrobacter oxydans]NSX36685.1 hypothetical protein [Pseudarthrobacter oxydans]BFE43755.1 hypothetical protein GCM10017547_16480 [Pseudarthrobacter oxydans]
MTQPRTPAGTTSGTDARPGLWQPVLLRSAAALVFGALTIFWAAPSIEVMGWAGGLYLLATGVLLLRTVPAAGLPQGAAPGKMLAAAGAVMAGAGFSLVLMHGDLLFGVVAAVGLGLAGALELAIGLTLRGRHVLARDWITSGIIGLGTAALLPFFIGLGAHALLGVAGGGAIISGVLWVLSGLTLRHDARSAAGNP